MQTEIMISGFGGQGVLFTGQLLAYAGTKRLPASATQRKRRSMKSATDQQGRIGVGYKHDSITFAGALKLSPDGPSKNSERTWRPLLELARDGDEEICLCPCDPCRSGRCQGGCRTCDRRFAGLGDMVLEEITTADYERAAVLAEARACQNGARRNERRESKGLIPLVIVLRPLKHDGAAFKGVRILRVDQIAVAEFL